MEFFMRKASKQPERVQSKSISAMEFAAAEPDCLREIVAKALSSLAIEQRSAFCTQVLACLEKAGLNVRQAVLMLGLSARKVEDLTSAEVATLIRYVRLTEPKMMKALAPTLAQLLPGTAPLKASHLSAGLGRSSSSR